MELCQFLNTQEWRNKKLKKIKKLFLSNFKLRFLVLIKKNNIIRKLNISTTAIPIVIEIGIANNINGNTFLIEWFIINIIIYSFFRVQCLI